MAKFIFGTPAHGHTNPSLPLVTELISRGEEVIYYSSAEFKDKIVATKAQYKDYELANNIDINAMGRDLSLLYYNLINITQLMLPKLLEDTKSLKPDCIIHDSIAVWGRYIATIYKIPAIASVSTFAFSKKTINISNTITFLVHAKTNGIRNILKSRNIQKSMFSTYGVRPRDFIDTMMNEELLNIVYCSIAFHPRVNDFNPRHYKFVGPMISKRKNDPDNTNYATLKHPLIYISMGTVWKDQYDIKTFIEALKNIKGTLVFSASLTNDELKIYDDNVIVKTHINQLEILKHCDVFFTHGGMNSVNEGIYYQVPLCVHPFQPEQEEVANQVVKMKLGVKVHGLTKNAIYSAVVHTLKNGVYKKNCIELSKKLEDSGGYVIAADAILSYYKELTNE